MRVLISGAGVGGLALAGFLKNSNIECTLIDKSKNWQHGGFSIGIWSNGRRMLRKLGIEDVDTASVPFKRMTIRRGNGSVIRDFELSKFDVELGSSLLHISRSQLHDWLLKAAGNPPIEMDCTITAIQQAVDGVRVTLSNGTERKYDLVVGADGVHSSVRSLSFGLPEHYENWRAWWLWCDPTLTPAHTIVEYVEPQSCIVLTNEGDKTLAVLMARAEHGVRDEEKGRVERIRDVFKKHTAIISKLCDAHADVDMMPSDLMTVTMKRWHTDNVVLIGDAAHAIAPFSALGASMALEDAYVLAGELMKEQSIAQALQIYERKRMPRVARARSLTARIRLLTAVSSSLLRTSINAVTALVPQNTVMRSYLSFLGQEL